MTNEQKYKTAEERVRAFFKGWRNHKSSVATVIAMDFSKWLALEAEEEKPENCPFCEGECNVIGEVNHRVKCTSCNYESIMDSDRDNVVAAHNRVARAVRAAREGDTK